MKNSTIDAEKLEHFKKLILDKAIVEPQHKNAYSRLIEKFLIVKFSPYLEKYTEQDFLNRITEDVTRTQFVALSELNFNLMDDITKADLELFDSYSNWSYYYFNPITEYTFGNGKLDFFTSELTQNFKNEGFKSIVNHLKKQPSVGVNWTTNGTILADFIYNTTQYLVRINPEFSVIRNEILAANHASEFDPIVRFMMFFQQIDKSPFERFIELCNTTYIFAQKGVYEFTNNFKHSNGINFTTKIKYNLKDGTLKVPIVNSVFTGIGSNAFKVINFLYQNRNTNSSGYDLDDFRELGLNCSTNKLQDIIRLPTEKDCFKKLTEKVGNKYIYKLK